tara:strand:- start:1657 stop:2139 length:483 start_codon:yes stop_codon:yes gene_type:complete
MQFIDIIFAPIVGILINFLLFVFTNYFKIYTINIRIIISFLAGMILLFTISIYSNLEVDYILSQYIIYFSLSFVNWNIYMLSATAQRIRIIFEIDSKKISYDALIKQYNTKIIYQKRFERLINLKIVKINNDIIILNNKRVLIIIYILNFFRFIIFGKKY